MQLLPPEYYQTLVADLGHMPGAEAAALSVYYPTYFRVTGPLPTEHYTRADGVAAPEVAVLPEFVSPGFFDLFRLPRLQGRDISWDDGPGKPDVALVSASLARALFPAGDAVGRHIRLAGPERRDDRSDRRRRRCAVRQARRPAAVRRLPADSAGPGAVAVSDGVCPRERRPRDGARWIHARREGAGSSVSAPVFMTSSEWVDSALLRERFTAGLATFAAAITILLACMGVYGLLAYSVTARVREIGVRLALGAARGTVVWMIVRDGLAIAVPGVLVGAPCAWAAARLVRAQLYGIAPGDSRTLLIAAAASLATVLAASLLPALRASRVAPVEALREE